MKPGIRQMKPETVQITITIRKPLADYVNVQVERGLTRSGYIANLILADKDKALSEKPQPKPSISDLDELSCFNELSCEAMEKAMYDEGPE